MNPNTIAESPPIEDYQARYDQLMVDLCRQMGNDTEYVELWLNSPRDDLNGRTPQSFIDEGKIEVVESFAWAMEHCLFT